MYPAQSLRFSVFVIASFLLLGVSPSQAAEAKPKPKAKQRADALEESRKAISSLRAAVEDLVATFPAEYTGGQGYLTRLDRLEEQISGLDAAALAKSRVPAAIELLKQDALGANPLLARQPILYVAREQYLKDHHNTATMFQTDEINTGSFRGGGALKSVDFSHPKPRVTTLFAWADGLIRDPNIRFDGQKILVSARRDIDDDYHLYELNADGTDLVQLTRGPGISDIDPIYLPSGQVMFSSTREPKFCMCNRHIMGNLFTMDADGANIQQVGHSTLHEGHAALMPDGRVLYDRWEYVDRNFGDAQGVWTVNPDGTNHAVYWGNNTNSPGGVLDARIVPGTELMICTFSSCHDRPWGAIALVDRRLGLDGKEPVLQTWPADAIDLVEVGNYDTFKKVSRKYEDPYPLSDKYFLVSGMTGTGDETGLWLLDTFGNEVLLHTDGPGCFDPLPLAPREKPQAIPSRVDLAQSDGYFYVSDVYKGTGMEVIPRGTVKRLRVVESPEKRYWTQQAWKGGGTQAPGMAWDDFNNKQILGSVPVEEDGSVYFAVPADTFLYFQLLDEHGMMVQSMRSGTIVRPGETAGCVGCHDQRRSTVPLVELPTAMLRSPDRLEPWHGEKRNFSYTAEVQHVFDKHCVSCHDFGQPAGETLNLAGDLGLMFNTSYVELRTKGFVEVVGAGPFETQLPKTWGSHASRLVDVLRSGHGDPDIDAQVEIDREAFDRIVTWVDINAPYYPEYGSAYRENLYGRSPLTPDQIDRLAKLTGAKLTNQDFSSHINFTRPELSPALADLVDHNPEEHAEALAIIEAGQAALQARPRADMPGFTLVDATEIDQEAKYREREAWEANVRASILEGRRMYDARAEAVAP